MDLFLGLGLLTVVTGGCIVLILVEAAIGYRLKLIFPKRKIRP